MYSIKKGFEHMPTVQAEVVNTKTDYAAEISFICIYSNFD